MNHGDTADLMTLQAALLVAISTLAAVVLILWKNVQRSQRRMGILFEECVRDRRKLWDRIYDLENRQTTAVK